MNIIIANGTIATARYMNDAGYQTIEQGFIPLKEARTPTLVDILTNGTTLDGLGSCERAVRYQHHFCREI